jgi:hypothetical protein
MFNRAVENDSISPCELGRERDQHAQQRSYAVHVPPFATRHTDNRTTPRARSDTAWLGLSFHREVSSMRQRSQVGKQNLAHGG